MGSLNDITVTEDENSKSAIVGTVPHEGKMRVAEIQGTRMRIVSPMEGWVSMMTDSKVVVARARRLATIPSPELPHITCLNSPTVMSPSIMIAASLLILVG